MILEWIAAACISLGALLMLLAGLGIFRFPDLFTRMQATTKASSLGILLVMLGVAIHFREPTIAAHAMLVVLFFFLTLPVSAHWIARASHRVGVPLWPGTLRDELEGLTVAERGPPDTTPGSRL